jgi:hypothetical protein
MRYREAYQFYMEALRKDPNLPEPPFRADTEEAYRTWKEELRAIDAARLALGLMTAGEIQANNTAFPRTGFRPRILTYAVHPRCDAVKDI